jgi:DNA ligase-associated metallophosphoesterase
MSARITVNGAALLADPTGAVFWPGQRLLVVSDLHLEKGSSFARRGLFLPPYDTRATLDRLARVLQRYRPQRVACLGASFHDGEAAGRLAGPDRDHLRRMVAAHDWIWIAGNHDPAPPAELGGVVMPELALDGLKLRHQPANGALATGEVCGHFHPKASVTTRGQRISSPCFVTDGRRMVMPAFGAFTGGLDVLDAALAGLFGRTGFRVFMIGRERLHMFARDRLMNGGPPRKAADG